MNVFLTPPRHLSRAMFRVANALAAHAPAGVSFVECEQDADLVVVHAVGLDAVQPTRADAAIIQYCFRTAGADLGKDMVAAWQERWRSAKVVWSYYDLRPVMPKGATFYLAPLGLDPAFVAPLPPDDAPRQGVVTTGFVHGRPAEAIQEVVVAAKMNGLNPFHLGPRPVNMDPHVRMFCGINLTDDILRSVYRRSRFVSGLRYIEGFELPALEGLACGAWPVFFDRPEHRGWFGNKAIYVDESLNAEQLTHALTGLFKDEPPAVDEDTHAWVRARFDWASIAEGFWAEVMK